MVVIEINLNAISGCEYNDQNITTAVCQNIITGIEFHLENV